MNDRGARRRATGFTLVELMIVVIVLGILVAVALPSYQGYVIRTSRSAAKSVLLQAAARQEQYFSDHKSYADSMTDLGYASDPVNIDNQGQPAGTNIVYQVSVTPQNAARTTNATVPVLYYTLAAAPQNRQTRDTKCGTLSLREDGQRFETGTDTAYECWR